MLYVKTKLKNSEISGIGLFADELIPKGKEVWKFEPIIDSCYSDADLETLTEQTRKQVLNYAFLDKKTNKYILCGDDARFFNHSEDPNCDDSSENITIALRDISIGEELTVNYKVFDGNYLKHHLK